MADLNELLDNGKAYTRCHRVIIENPIGGTPSVLFMKQDVATIGDRTISGESGAFRMEFDPSYKVMLRDPQTGELTGGYITQGDLYAGLYSAFITLALNDGVMPEQVVLQP